MKSLFNKNSKSIFFNTTIFAVLFVTVQCSKDDPEPINEEETITTVTLSLTKSGESTATTYTWNDGGTAPSITLAANSTYSASVTFLDESDPSDVEDITEEVVEEVDEHQIFYQIQGAVAAIASASDDEKDSANNPLMLKTVWTTSGAASGSVQVYLIHEPTTKSGSTREAFGGETDVQVNFPVSVQ